MADKQRISYVPLEAMTAGDAGRDGALRARGHAAAGELGGPRARPGRVLVLRQQLARPVPQRRLDHAIKELCRVYVSRSVKCEYCGNQRSEQGARARARRGPVRRAAQLRERRRLRRAPEGRARLRGGDRLAPRHRRRVLGAHARALQRARAGRARLHDRPDARPAELAADAEHRPPRGHAGHERLDGARVRDARGRSRRTQGVRRATGRTPDGARGQVPCAPADDPRRRRARRGPPRDRVAGAEPGAPGRIAERDRDAGCGRGARARLHARTRRRAACARAARGSSASSCPT